MRRVPHRLAAVALMLAASWTVVLAAEPSRLPLQVLDAEPGLAAGLVGTAPSVRPAAGADLIVIGTIRDKTFSVASAGNLRVVDAAGRNLPVWIETSTVIREFDEITSARMAFALSPAAAAAGGVSVEWGADIQTTPVAVERLTIGDADQSRVRSFAVGAAGAAKNDAQFATVEIIADSHADQYYLWYLVPMLGVIGLLIARKLALK